MSASKSAATGRLRATFSGAGEATGLALIGTALENDGACESCAREAFVDCAVGLAERDDGAAILLGGA